MGNFSGNSRIGGNIIYHEGNIQPKVLDILNKNNVSIGGTLTITGTATLAGTSVSSLRVGTSTTAGNILKADASGNATWTTPSNFAIKIDSGITEGTDLYTYNPWSAETIDFKSGTNVTLTDAAGTVTFSSPSLSLGTTSGSGNAVTDIAVSGHTITMTKGSTFLTSSTGVTTWSGGLTGLTPNTATSGAVSLAGTLGAGYGGTGQNSYAIGDILYASASTTISKLADVATGSALISGGVGVAPSYGKVGLTTHVSGTLAVGNGGTGTTTAPTQGGIIYGASTSAYGSTAVGTAGQVLKSNGTSAPTWVTLDMTYLPDAVWKKSVKVATTTNLTATATTTTLTNSGTLAALVIDGITLAANDRVLVKNQTTSSQNGIYYVSNVGSASVAWILTRVAGADSVTEVAGAVVNVDQGTSGGILWSNNFKTTDTLGTTAMPWYRVYSEFDSDTAATANKLALRDSSGHITATMYHNTSGSATTICGGDGSTSNTSNFVEIRPYSTSYGLLIREDNATAKWANIQVDSVARPDKLFITYLVDGTSTANKGIDINSTGDLGVSGDLTVSGGDIYTTAGTASTLFNNTTTGNVTIFGSQTTGTLTIGGSAGTGTISIAPTTDTQTVNIGSGATASGKTFTVNFGTGGLSGSTTNINVGSSASGGTITLNEATSITNTTASTSTATGALKISGGLGVAGAINGGSSLTLAGSVFYDDVSRYWLATATNWGLYWNTTDNQIEFHGSGTMKAEIDLDDGSISTTGALSVNSTSTLTGTVTFGGALNKSSAFQFLNGAAAQQIQTGSVLASDAYGDASKVPVNGVYSKGDISTNGNVNIQSKFSVQYNSTENSLDFVYIG